LNLKKVHNKQQAYELFNKYNICADEIIKADPNRQLLQSNIDFYFEHMEHELTKEAYDFVDTFIKSGYANGYTKVMSDYFLEHNVKPADAKGLWNSFVHLSSKAMTPMNTLEQIDRMAEYMMFKERGLDSTTAFYNVAKTFFAFGERPYSAYLAGSIFPYYTFTLRNLKYWQEALEKQPLLSNYFSDIMRPVWNFDDLDNDELNANRSLQARLISGSIPLTAAGLTLKTNPSFMDPISALINPIQFVTSKIYSPIQSALSAMISSSQLPYPFKAVFNASKTEYTYTLTDNGYIIWKNGSPMYTQYNYRVSHGLTAEQYAKQKVEQLREKSEKMRAGTTDSNEYAQDTSNLGDYGKFLLEQLPLIGSIYQRYFEAAQTNKNRLTAQGGTGTEQLLSQLLPGTFGVTKQYVENTYEPLRRKPYHAYEQQPRGYYPNSRNPKKTYGKKTYAKKTYVKKTPGYYQQFTPNKYKPPIKNRITQPMKNDIKYSNYRKFFYRSFYSSNYNKAGISHVSSMMQPTTSKNLQYRIRDDNYAFYHR
jgi:hypothetical protein